MAGIDKLSADTAGRTARQRAKLPIIDMREFEVRTLDDWIEFARRDDCLNHMVPSDLRTILGNINE